MSVPDIVRNVTKSVRDKFSEQEEVKDKAKGLPLYVIRQALTGVGQALLFGNRLRNRLVGGDGKDGEEKTDAKAEITTTVTPEETKPARREPVIFAPRPGTNGTNPETEAVAETKTAEVTVESTEPAPAESAEVVEPADPKAEAKVTAEAEDAADRVERRRREQRGNRGSRRLRAYRGRQGRRGHQGCPSHRRCRGHHGRHARERP